MTTIAEPSLDTPQAPPPSASASGLGGRRILAPVRSGVIGFVSRFWGILAILAVWQVYVATQNLNAIVIPSPAAVAADLINHPDAYLGHAWSTIWVAAVGLVLGVTLGVTAAVLSWTSPMLSGMVTPPAMVIRSVPVVAMIPVIARILGYDIRTVLAITVIISFFPSFVFTASGLRDLPAGSSDLFAVMGSGRFTILRRLALPSAVPNLLVAVRLSAANCILAALVAEFLMGTQGLGYLFVRTRSELNMARSWGAALVATVLSVVAFILAARLEQRGRERWR